MEPKQPDEQLTRIAGELSDIRDSWVLLSLALKDHLADVSYEQKDAMNSEAEVTLARIRQSRH